MSALNIEKITQKWGTDQVAIAKCRVIKSMKRSKEKKVVLRLISNNFENIDEAIDFFPDQTGFINLLTCPEDNKEYGMWIRIEAKEFFRIADALRERIILSDNNRIPKPCIESPKQPPPAKPRSDQ